MNFSNLFNFHFTNFQFINFFIDSNVTRFVVATALTQQKFLNILFHEAVTISLSVVRISRGLIRINAAKSLFESVIAVDS